jgi:FKBP-type peptidyl-prolyl cis-trans isomerase
VLRKGDGTKPAATDTVLVHYRGWLPESADGSEGPEFDSSYSRREPISFPLNGVIAGWTEGLQLVSKGGMIELDIPSELAYGPRAMGDVIKPNSDLRFVVELLDIR